MFSSDKKTKKTMETNTQQNIVAKGTTIVGDINSQGPFRIDGTVEGNVITSGKVVVGKSGLIKGTLKGDTVDFEGTFNGKMQLSGTLSIKATAHIEGEIQVSKLAVEPGANFNATCSMKGAVKSLANDGSKPETASGSEKTA
ncbi:MAG: polymer-forming cytoskeletal protein [Winogradskyella sp.]|nr:polymer-forming cytoskeletal protein [Winogradskyella sp.]MBT8375609.1 polymer-forming cytoskeletal protein [Bacteroidia bacterium]NNC44946.1 polymer-forming cytoskeletal protein [Winogradskyella sp.]NNF85467.1 polymer-forming cytoskeletal protein [Winogradskyella sp.]NNK39330.1 polymer-forming cytoskeletal protein [Winogradskyella sp.]